MDIYVGSIGRANEDNESWEKLHTSHISVFQWHKKKTHKIDNSSKSTSQEIPGSSLRYPHLSESHLAWHTHISVSHIWLEIPMSQWGTSKTGCHIKDFAGCKQVTIKVQPTAATGSFWMRLANLLILSLTFSRCLSLASRACRMRLRRNCDRAATIARCAGIFTSSLPTTNSTSQNCRASSNLPRSSCKVHLG